MSSLKNKEKLKNIEITLMKITLNKTRPAPTASLAAKINFNYWLQLNFPSHILR